MGALPSGEDSQYYGTHFQNLSFRGSVTQQEMPRVTVSQPLNTRVQRYCLQSPVAFALALGDKTGSTNSALSKDLAGT